jgi:hypothetical protein
MKPASLGLSLAVARYLLEHTPSEDIRRAGLMCPYSMVRPTRWTGESEHRVRHFSDPLNDRAKRWRSQGSTVGDVPYQRPE